MIQGIGSKIFIYGFFISFLIISFFTFDYHYSKRDFELIDKFVKKIKLFSSEEIKAIQSNLQIIRKKHSKQVIFLNSVIGFLWSFAIITFITAYKKGDYIMALEIFEEHFSKFLAFLVVFILIRGHSKIYDEIFDIAEYACNEATTVCKK
ncbi:hypothetical protein ABW636_11430 [Aquimarina sp. 2201CG1-2-11]|uniref:hypothetical protein n=1 Tax=Aquimarina discodermiae TaxID=3231043 RepID=UPI00346348A1